MTEGPVDPAVLDALRKLDTPTVCNALEIAAPERRGYGYTVEPLVCARTDLPPIVGYARTATIRAMQPSQDDAETAKAKRLAYYTHIAEGPGPTVTVIQDLDGGRIGYGAFWGEVNSNIHKGLGCLGVVTDGSIRDLEDIAEGFQLLAGRVGPSHAHVHLVDVGGTVNVAGMVVSPGDLIHADRHGAVVIPANVAAEVPAAAELISRREAVILNAAKSPDFDIEKLKQAMADQAEIH